MSHADDTDGVGHDRDREELEDRLLAGGVDDPSPVAGLIAALRLPTEPGELAGTDELVAAMAAAVRSGTERTSRRAPVLTGRAAGLAAAVLLFAGTAAAATGNLPAPLQRTVSKTFSHVGVDVPSSGDSSEPATSSSAATTSSVATTTTSTIVSASSTSVLPASPAPTAAAGPDASGPAMRGLCVAYLAKEPGSKSLDAVAFRNLTQAAAAAGQTVEEFCTSTTGTTTATTSGKPAKPAEPGNSGSTPATTAPEPAAHPGDYGSTPAATAPKHTTTSVPSAPPSSGHGRP